MSDVIAASPPPARPEFERPVTAPIGLGDVARPLSLGERLSGNATLRRALILIGIAIVWELYARFLDNPLTFPTFLETLAALRDGILSGVIPLRLAVTLETLVIGYAIGLAVAALLTTIAVTTRLGTDLLSTFTAMFNPCPRSRSCRSRFSGSASGAHPSSSSSCIRCCGP